MLGLTGLGAGGLLTAAGLAGGRGDNVDNEPVGKSLTTDTFNVNDEFLKMLGKLGKKELAKISEGVEK
jgi:hypothetical protein